MYAKLMIYDEEGSKFRRENVELIDGKNHLPSSATHIFEAERITYRIMRIQGVKSHYRIVDELNPNCLFLSSVPLNLEIPEDPKNDDLIYNIIILTVFKKGEDSPTHFISARNSVLWLMNEEGKTIDKTNIRGVYTTNISR